MPKITIGIPVRNGAAFLARAIDSVLAQTFEDFEVLIADNASTDATPAICEDYARRDRRVRYVRHRENIGSVANFNLLFSTASSEYFKWASHDDLLAPTFIETGLRELEADPTLVLYSPNTLFIEEDGTPFSAGTEKDTFVDRSGRCWYSPTYRDAGLASHDPTDRFEAVMRTINMCFEIFGVIRSAALRRTSLMGEYWGCDKVLLAELSLLGRYFEDPQRLFYWRYHPAQSMRLSFRQQGWWTSGRRRTGYFQRSQKLLGYMNALRGKGLSWQQEMRCLRSMVHRSVKPGRIRQLLAESAGRPI